MIGKASRAITVKQLYNYAQEHNYLDADTEIVLDIIRKDTNYNVSYNIHNSKLCTSNDTLCVPDFDNLIEYSIEDLLKLLSYE